MLTKTLFGGRSAAYHRKKIPRLEWSVFGDRDFAMRGLRYLTQALLSCWRRRDSGGDSQSMSAYVAGSELERTHRRVLGMLA